MNSARWFVLWALALSAVWQRRRRTCQCGISPAEFERALKGNKQRFTQGKKTAAATALNDVTAT